MTSPLSGKKIVLGVTGSIACYKALDLASKLTQSGASVDTILTNAASQFINKTNCFRNCYSESVIEMLK